MASDLLGDLARRALGDGVAGVRARLGPAVIGSPRDVEQFAAEVRRLDGRLRWLAPLLAHRPADEVTDTTRRLADASWGVVVLDEAARTVDRAGRRLAVVDHHAEVELLADLDRRRRAAHALLLDEIRARELAAVLPVWAASVADTEIAERIGPHRPVFDEVTPWLVGRELKRARKRRPRGRSIEPRPLRRFARAVSRLSDATGRLTAPGVPGSRRFARRSAALEPIVTDQLLRADVRHVLGERGPTMSMASAFLAGQVVASDATPAPWRPAWRRLTTDKSVAWLTD